MDLITSIMDDKIKKDNNNNMIKERTFKDDVLSLVNKGKDNDSFDYYVVSLRNAEYVDGMVSVNKKAIGLKYDKYGTKLLEDYSYPTISSNNRFSTYIYFLKNPTYRREFVFRFYLNIFPSAIKSIEEYVLFAKSSYILTANCKVYFPANSASEQEIKNKIEIFKRVYLERVRINPRLTIYSRHFLFYCVFFNEYSNIGLLDNYVSCLKHIKNQDDSPIPLNGINENDIKEIISQQAKMYHQMQEGMDLIKS